LEAKAQEQRVHTENFQRLGGCEGKGLAGFDRVFGDGGKSRQMMGLIWTGSNLILKCLW